MKNPLGSSKGPPKFAVIGPPAGWKFRLSAYRGLIQATFTSPDGLDVVEYWDPSQIVALVPRQSQSGAEIPSLWFADGTKRAVPNQSEQEVLNVWLEARGA